jgi:hypothetical protein
MTQLPTTGQHFNPGNARWCEEHKRLECTKNRSKGRGQCHGIAVKGLDGCTTHVGHSRAVARAKGEAVITAWSAVGAPAGGKSLDASMAVLGMLQMSWLRAAAYGELLRQQVSDREHVPDPDNFDPADPVVSSGLIGYRYGAAGKDGNIYAVSEEVRALVALEAAERDRVVKYAKTAHDMGISERITNLAERWGDVVAGRITLILAALQLTPEQEAMVPALIQAHLGQIDVMALGSSE